MTLPGGTSSSRLLTPAELAEWLRVDRAYVYEHAAELGAFRLGSGPKARLRFDLAEVRSRLTACSAGRSSAEPEPAPRQASSRRRPRGMGTSGGSVPELLPIGGSRRLA